MKQLFIGLASAAILSLSACDATIQARSVGGGRTVIRYSTTLPNRSVRPQATPAADGQTSGDGTNWRHGLATIINNENQARYDDLVRRANAGDAEAQEWVRNYGPIFRLTNGVARQANGQ